MMQQMYPQVDHDYMFELNKDLTFQRHISFLTNVQENVHVCTVIRTLSI